MALTCASLGLVFLSRSWVLVCAGAAAACALAIGLMDWRGLATLAALVWCSCSGSRPALQVWGHPVSSLTWQWLVWVAAAAVMSGVTPGFYRSIWTQDLLIKTDAIFFVPELRLQHVLVACVLVLSSDAWWARRWLAPGRLWGCVAPAAGVVAVLMPLAWGAGAIRLERAPGALVPLFVLHNLALVVVPEEVLFRGALQQLLLQSLPTQHHSPLKVSCCAAMLFGLGHAAHGPLLMLLSVVAGVGYGLAFWRSGGLLGAVCAHLAVNVVHFVGFSYPALR